MSTPPSLHRYLYAFSNPTVYTDPDGHANEFEGAQANSGDAPRFGDKTGDHRYGDTTVGESLDSSSSSASTPNTKQRRKEAECRDAGGGYECVGSANDEIEAQQRAKDRTKKTETAENPTLDGNKRLHTSEERLKEVFSFKGFIDEDAYRAYKKAYDNGDAKEAATILALNLLKNTKQGQLLDATVTCLKNPSIACLDGINKRSRPKDKKKKGGNCCKPSCFVAGTLVQTEIGLIPIEEVEEGLLVAARDEVTGDVSWKPVATLFQYDDNRVTYNLTLSDQYGGYETYEVTDNHPFYVDNVGWVDSINLETGMDIPSYHGWTVEVVSLEPLYRSPITYNFEVADYHTYFVGKLGAWVHNQKDDCSCEYKMSDNLYNANPSLKENPQIVKEYDKIRLGLGTPRVYTMRDFREGNIPPGSSVGSQIIHEGRKLPKWRGALEWDVPGTNNRILELNGKLGYAANHRYDKIRFFPAPWFSDGGKPQIPKKNRQKNKKKNRK